MLLLFFFVFFATSQAVWVSSTDFFCFSSLFLLPSRLSGSVHQSLSFCTIFSYQFNKFFLTTFCVFLQNADMRFFATWSTAATKLAATTSAFGTNLLKYKYNKEHKYNRNNKYNRNHKYNQKCKYIGITNEIWKTNIAFGKGCVCQKLGGHCWTNSLSGILDLGLVILWWRFPDPDYSTIQEWGRSRTRRKKEEKPTERTMKMMKQEHKKVTHEMLKIFTLWGKIRS